MKRINGTYFMALPAAMLLSVSAAAYDIDSTVVATPYQTGGSVWETASMATPANLDNAEKSPVYDLRNKLTGILPGVEVIETSGDIMPSSNMGSASINSNTVELASHGMSGIVLIVDDVLIPYNQYQFDLNQVESISFLSGATAKAKYGPAASYGALYIVTKKGDWNKPLKITADLRAGMDFVDRMPEWVNGYEYATLNNTARENDGYTVLYDEQALEGYKAGDMYSREYPSVDYRSLMMRNYKSTQNFGLELEGGTRILKYNASLNGYRSDDIYKVGSTSQYNRLNLSTSIQAKIGKWLMATVSFNGLTAFRNGNCGTLYGWRTTPANAFPVALGISTNDSELEDVSAGNTIYAVSRSFTSNPYAEMVDGGFYTTRYRSGMFSAAIDFDLGFLVKGLKSRTYLSDDAEYYQKVGKDDDYIAYYWSSDGGVAEISSHVGTKQASKSSKGTFTYNNLSFYERLYYDWEKNGHRLSPSAVFYISNGSNASNSYYQRQAYLTGSIDYSYKGKYTIETAFQYAGCSRYSSANRFAFFPSVALGWLASEEKFIREAGWIDRLKLSVDVGSIADANVFGTNYLYRASYVSASGNTFGPATAYQWFGTDKRTSQTTTIERLANSSLKWPRIFQADVRLDAQLFHCLTFGVNLYMLKREGLLTNISSELTAMTGLDGVTYYDNYNEYTTRGIDFNIQFTKKFGDFTLSLGGNAMSWETVYTKYAGDTYIYDYQKIEGSTTDAYRGFVCLGRFTSEEEIASSALYDANTKVGDLKYKDMNEDGVIDLNDRTIIGNTAPRFRYSVNIDLRWRNWSLYLVGTGRTGFDVALTSEYFWNGWGDSNYSAFVRDNIGGDYPRLGYDKSTNNFVASDWWLRDGSYFKLQTAELGYDLPLKDKKVFKGVRFSLRGSNLLTITNVKYIDPEAVSSGVSTYPLFRTVALGAKLIF